MRKLVTCPEWGRLADLETFEDDRERVGFIAHCSLWEEDEILESCVETCAEYINRRRASREGA